MVLKVIQYCKLNQNWEQESTEQTLFSVMRYILKSDTSPFKKLTCQEIKVSEMCCLYSLLLGSALVTYTVNSES